MIVKLLLFSFSCICITKTHAQPDTIRLKYIDSSDVIFYSEYLEYMCYDKSTGKHFLNVTNDKEVKFEKTDRIWLKSDYYVIWLDSDLNQTESMQVKHNNFYNLTLIGDSLLNLNGEDLRIFSLTGLGFINKKSVPSWIVRDSVYYENHNSSVLLPDGSGFVYSYTPVGVKDNKIKEPMRIYRDHPCMAKYSFGNDSITNLPIYYPVVYKSNVQYPLTEYVHLGVNSDSLLVYCFSAHPFMYFFDFEKGVVTDSVYCNFRYLDTIVQIESEVYLGSCERMNVEMDTSMSYIYHFRIQGDYAFIYYKIMQARTSIMDDALKPVKPETFVKIYSFEDKRWLYEKPIRRKSNFIVIDNVIYTAKTRKTNTDPLLLIKLNY